MQILSCLTHPDPPTLLSWTLQRNEMVSADDWQAWQELEGRDLWLGYDAGGWETTGDERAAGRLVGDDYLVWLFYSPTRNEYDILPFADTRLFADSVGDHYGMHPCGGWAIDAEIIEGLIDGN